MTHKIYRLVHPPYRIFCSQGCRISGGLFHKNGGSHSNGESHSSGGWHTNRGHRQSRSWVLPCLRELLGLFDIFNAYDDHWSSSFPQKNNLRFSNLEIFFLVYRKLLRQVKIQGAEKVNKANKGRQEGRYVHR